MFSLAYSPKVKSVGAASFTSTVRHFDPKEVGRTHDSIVICPVKFNVADGGTVTTAVVPLKLRECPDFAVVDHDADVMVPLFPLPLTSFSVDPDV